MNVAFAAEVTVTWDGGGDGLSFLDPDNWDPTAIPDNNLDSYRVVLGPGAFVELTQTATINFLSVAASAELVIDGGGELRVVGAGEGLEATRGIQNNGFVTLGGPMGGGGSILISLFQTFSGSGLFRSAESVRTNAVIGVFSVDTTLIVPSGSSLRFGANDPALDRGLRILLGGVEILGSVTFADLDELEIVTLHVVNNNLMLFQNTLAELTFQQLDSSAGVGVIRDGCRVPVINERCVCCRSDRHLGRWRRRSLRQK